MRILTTYDDFQRLNKIIHVIHLSAWHLVRVMNICQWFSNSNWHKNHLEFDEIQIPRSQALWFIWYKTLLVSSRNIHLHNDICPGGLEITFWKTLLPVLLLIQILLWWPGVATGGHFSPPKALGELLIWKYCYLGSPDSNFQKRWKGKSPATFEIFSPRPSVTARERAPVSSSYLHLFSEVILLRCYQEPSLIPICPLCWHFMSQWRGRLLLSQWTLGNRALFPAPDTHSNRSVRLCYTEPAAGGDGRACAFHRWDLVFLTLSLKNYRAAQCFLLGTLPIAKSLPKGNEKKIW